MENMNENQDQVLANMKKEIEEKNKTIWTAMSVIITISITFLVIGSIYVACFVPNETWQIIGIVGIFAIALPACFYALKLETSVGYYECKKCGEKIVPKYHETVFAMHCGTTRYLKCSKCNKKTWHRKVI